MLVQDLFDKSVSNNVLAIATFARTGTERLPISSETWFAWKTAWSASRGFAGGHREGAEVDFGELVLLRLDGEAVLRDLMGLICRA